MSGHTTIIDQARPRSRKEIAGKVTAMQATGGITYLVYAARPAERYAIADAYQSLPTRDTYIRYSSHRDPAPWLSDIADWRLRA